jgi:hypothetical protein
LLLKSLRHEFDVENSPVNALHGASTPEQAERELQRFFPVEQTLAVLKPGLSPEKKSNTLSVSYTLNTFSFPNQLSK